MGEENDSFFEKIQRISTPISLIGGIGFGALYTYYCIYTYFKGVHKIILNYNMYGEHLLETFVLPVYLGFMVFALYTYLSNDKKRED